MVSMHTERGSMLSLGKCKLEPQRTQLIRTGKIIKKKKEKKALTISRAGENLEQPERPVLLAGV